MGTLTSSSNSQPKIIPLEKFELLEMGHKAQPRMVYEEVTEEGFQHLVKSPYDGKGTHFKNGEHYIFVIVNNNVRYASSESVRVASIYNDNKKIGHSSLFTEDEQDNILKKHKPYVQYAGGFGVKNNLFWWSGHSGHFHPNTNEDKDIIASVDHALGIPSDSYIPRANMDETGAYAILPKIWPQKYLKAHQSIKNVLGYDIYDDLYDNGYNDQQYNQYIASVPDIGPYRQYTSYHSYNSLDNFALVSNWIILIIVLFMIAAICMIFSFISCFCGFVVGYQQKKINVFDNKQNESHV